MGRQGRAVARVAAMAAMLVSGVASAADAEGALYGDLRLSLDYTEDRTGVPGPTYTATDNQSTWGLKFSTERGGVKVSGAYERYIDAGGAAATSTTGDPVEVTRQAWLGLSSMCGQIRFGRHATAYSEAGRKLDPFYDTAASGTAGIATAGTLFGAGNSHGSSAAFNADAFGGAYVADHLAYRSPSFGGLTTNVAMFLDRSGSADQNHDYGLGFEWDQHGFTLGAQFIDANGAQAATWGANVEAARFYFGYAEERFGTGLSWERLDLPGQAVGNYTMVSGWYALAPHTRIAASVGFEDSSPTGGDSQRVGIFHDLMDDFTVWSAVRRYNGPGSTDADVITFGASYAFDFRLRAS